MAADGIRPPQFAFEREITRLENVITGVPFGEGADSPLWADAKVKIAALETSGQITEEDANQLLNQAQQALTESILPAFSSYIAWLESDMANADEEPRGVSALPNGTAYYDRQLARYTTLELTADEVHELGLAEVARIRAEMEKIRSDVGFDGDLNSFFDDVRDDPRFFYPNTDEGRAAYIEQVETFLAEIREKLPDFFGLLPKAELVVRRVEPFREVDGGAQHYDRPAPDGSKPGIYYLHMSDMSAYSAIDLETTAYHEGLPGHHMQSAIAQELTGVPVFRSRAFFTVYSEGWALYAELLAKEMGQFRDPYNDFGRLTAEIWRAIRLVVDTGLHAKGWSEEEAVQYFLSNSAVPEPAVRSEIRRYITTPGQATSYKIGMLKILELRSLAREQLGDEFDIREFHDVILGGGPLPMAMLEARIDSWLRSKSS